MSIIELLAASRAKKAQKASAQFSDFPRQLAKDQPRVIAASIAGTTPEALLGNRLSSYYADSGARNSAGDLCKDGDSVAQWAPVSTAAILGGIATQTTPALCPIWVQNGKEASPTIRFSGAQVLNIADDVVFRPQTGEFHIFALLNGPSRRPVSIVLAKGNQASSSQGYSIFADYVSNATGSTIFVRSSDGTAKAGQTVTNPNSACLIEAHFSGTTLTGALNGSTANWTDGGAGATGTSYAATINNTDILKIGGNASPSYGDLDVVALFFVKGAMTVAEIATMRSYCLALSSPIKPAAAKNYGNEVIVAASGVDSGTTRIPAHVIFPDGSILVAYEARQANSDTGYIKIVGKRSTDGGKTWGGQYTIADDGTNTLGNPVLILNRNTNRLHLYMTGNLAQDSESAINGGTSVDTRRPYHMYSDDKGMTWSARQDLTAAVKPAGARWFATGPGGFEQLANGRILVPCNYSTAPNTYYPVVIYSDDDGVTHQMGATSTANTLANEGAFCQFADGTLYFNYRQNGGTARVSTTSTDNGLTFTAPFAVDGGQSAFPTEGSVLHYGQFRGKDVGLISVPSDPAQRYLGTVYLTTNKGKTWPAATVIRPGYFGYSSMFKLPSGKVGIVFEANSGSVPIIYFGTFDLAYPAFENPI
jgi:sialidase-1